MATIFLDTNILISIFQQDAQKARDLLKHKLFFSPLSCHILACIIKTKIPNIKLNQMLEDLGIVAFTPEILTKSLRGPTPDLEDNIQLHSAANENCQYFLTNDKQLLKIGYFGQTEIVSSI